MKDLLKIESLCVRVNGKDILKNVNLKISARQTQALLGPNASGKSTFAQTIVGNPKYKINKGRIFFLGKNITRTPSEKRANLGLVLSWQFPPAIKGIKLSYLLEKISKDRKFEIEKSKSLLERDVNVDLSGGEKKISELIQVFSLNPKLIIFDEIDSGLDIKKIENVSKIIKKEFSKKEKNFSILLITHSGAILNFLKPDITNVMVNGRIICKEKNHKKVLRVIKKYGYEKCKKCSLLADRQ